MDSYSCRGKKVSEIGSLSEKESFCYRVLHRTVKGLSLRLSCFCSCVLFCFCVVVFFGPLICFGHTDLTTLTEINKKSCKVSNTSMCVCVCVSMCGCTFCGSKSGPMRLLQPIILHLSSLPGKACLPPPHPHTHPHTTASALSPCLCTSVSLLF